MALGTLTLSTTQGVQGRRFAAKINGLTTGRVEVVGYDGSPGFSTVNGMLYSNGLPYPTSTVVLREYDPGAATSVKETRIDITAVTAYALMQQATAALGVGRSLVSAGTYSTTQADGSTSYSLYVRDDLGATTVQATGGTTPVPIFTAQPSISPISAASGSTFTATPGTVSNGSITSRAWLLNGTSISTGLTATPGSTGTLTYQEFATGAGGSASSAVQSATVSAAALASLPAVSAAPTIVAGAYAAVAGYTGPLIRVQNSSGAQQDISADGTGFVSTSAILSFCNVSTIDGVLVTTAYDQSGGGNHLTQATTANMPKMTVGVTGTPTIFFDGAATYFNLPASLSTNIAGFTLLHTGRYLGGSIVQFGTSSGAYQNLGITSSYGTYRMSMGNSARTTSQNLFANNSVFRWQSSSAALKIGQNAPATTSSAMVAATYTGGLVGASTVVASQYFSGNMTLFALYPTLTDADANSVSSVMQSNEAITSGRTKNLVMVLDSLTAGFQSTFGRSRSYYLEQSIGAQANIYIVAQSGRTTATENAIYAAQVAPLYVSGQTNVIASFGGTNDLHTYSAFSPETDSTTPTAEYSVKTLNQSARTTGFTVVGYDIPVSSTAGANRAAFNSWFDANINSWASYRVDFQQSSAYTGTTGALQTAYSSGDGTHPNSAGYQVFAAWELNAIKYALGLATPPAAPVNSVLPSIAGTPSVGNALSVTPGVWSNSPTQLAYQWKRNGVNIQDANGTSYTLVSADAGTTITVSEAASIQNGNIGAVALSAGVSISGAAGAPANTTAPAISGTPVVGNVQTASTGAWTNSPTSYAYQWLLNGTAISGATSSTYTPTTAGSLTVAVTATNASGSATSTSAAVTIGAALSISGTPPGGTINTAYTYTPTISGGSGARTFAQSGTALPAGLSFSTSTGAITGTPTTAGTTSGIVIGVSDASGSASQTVSITIGSGGGSSITADSNTTTADNSTITADHV